MDISIVIPTKNAGDLLETVLEAVFNQKTKYEYEVICVDSGSKDNTLKIIKKYPCKLYEIPASEFGHGKTRNYGATQGTGEYIVFITQDACPKTEDWLENFVNAMKIDPDIVGGFGIHYPYPDCNLFDQRDLEMHFQGFGSENTIFYLEDKKRYEEEEGYRHLLSFFSDNNSCIRRNIWEKYPYEDVNFAEDQIWARKMIELGYKKVYCPTAPVYHSHNYKLLTYFKRYFDEYKSLYGLHQYLIVNKWTAVLPGAARHIYSDFKYLKQIELPKTQKIKWAWYSFWRNIFRYSGGYLGGKYASYGPKTQKRLDRFISQQSQQIKG